MNLSEIKEALEIEIQFLQRKYRDTKIFLSEGSFDGKEGENFIYVFETEDDIVIPEDTPIKILHNKVEIDGTLLRVDPKKIYISLTEDFGPIIRDVILINNPAGFLQKLLDKYEQVDKGEIKINTNLLQNLYSGNNTSINNYKDSDLLNQELTEDKKKAVLNSLNHEYRLIWGPPGTGKTFSLTEIIFQLLKKSKKVLITSNTHKAVDEVLEKLLYKEDTKDNEYLKSSIIQELLNNQQILRYGGGKRFQMNDLSKQMDITLDALALDKSKILKVDKEKLEKEEKTIISSLDKKKSLVRIKRKVDEVEENNGKINNDLRIEETKFITRKTEEKELQDKIKSDSKRYNQLNNELISRKQYLESLKEYYRILDRNDNIKETISRQKQNIKLSKEELSSLKIRKKALNVTLQKHTDDYEKCKESNFITNFISGRSKDVIYFGIVETENKLNNINKSIEKYEEEISDFQVEVDNLSGELTETEDKRALHPLHDLEKDGVIQEGNKVKDVITDLKEKIDQLGYESLLSKQDDLREEISEVIERIQSLKDELTRNKKLLERVYNDAVLKKEIDSLVIADTEEVIKQEETKLDGIQTELDAINKKLASIREEVVQGARLIACTATKAMMTAQTLLKSPPDVILVDEFSMIGLPLILFVAGLSQSQVIFVGDPKQLPPIYMSPSEKVKKYLGTNIYKELLDRGNNNNNVDQLTKEFRMNTEILKIINTLFYENTLEETDKLNSKHLEEPFLSESNVTLIDTSNINPWCSRERNLENGSRINLYSSLLATTLISKLKDKNVKVGYISPYAGQARLINKILKNNKLDEFCVSGTVHRFQGDEREIIFFDTTDSNPFAPSGLLRKFFWNHKDKDYSNITDAPNLLNVACSRAEKKLVIIANLKYFKNKFLNSPHKVDEPLLKLFALIQKKRIKGNIIPAEELLGYQTKDIEKLRKEIYGKNNTPNIFDLGNNKTAFLSEMEFYTRLEEDLMMAQKEVIILSPFVTKRRISKMKDLFKGLIEKRINIDVYTKPPKEQGDTLNSYAAIKYLEKIGISNIYFRPKMHEKIVIIDNKVAYVGSLNPLSQFVSKELMIRSDSKEYLKGLLFFISSFNPRTVNIDESDLREDPISVEEAERELKNLRKMICFEKRLHFGTVLRNQTISELLNNRPSTIEDLQKISEFSNVSLQGFEDKILAIIRRIY